jgi:hypothetical protein
VTFQITVVKFFDYFCQFSSKICVFFSRTQFPVLALFYKVSKIPLHSQISLFLHVKVSKLQTK